MARIATLPRPSTLRRRSLIAALCAALAAHHEVLAHPTRAPYADLSLEELMNETVTSVSKRERKLSDTAAAITVLSNDEIRRSGATHLADVLRVVPGLNVASVSSNEWSVSARGFNNVFANKLLVLVDGRAVYSPLFAGVHWDSLRLVLEDVDRVEVIRGPGSTVWGANAVNGVINVVTRDARDTQGAHVQAYAGDVERAGGDVRYGGRIDDKTYYRVRAGAFARDDFRLPDGRPAGDSWQGEHGAVRIDHHPADDAKLVWQAGGTSVGTARDATDAHNVHTLARLTKDWSERSGIEIQAYYDQARRNESRRANTRIDTLDLSAQHSFGLGEQHDITWGLGYRHAETRLAQNNFTVLVRDERHESHLGSFFIQDEFHLLPDRLTLTGGVKVEHNNYTGFEFQPGARAAFKPTARQTIWAASSRAVRTPSVLEYSDAFAIAAGAPFPGPGGGIFVPRLVGSDDVRSEELWATELGYRFQPTSKVHLDLAVFYNRYENLVGIGGISGFAPGTPGTAELPFTNHEAAGETRGGEIALTVSPASSWRISASYSLLFVDLPGADANPYERASPRNQVVLRSSHDLTRRLGLDAQLRYVDNLHNVPAYLTADLRLAYRHGDHLEFALVGRNLLQDQHPEQAPFHLTPVSEVPRGVHGSLTWRF